MAKWPDGQHRGAAAGTIGAVTGGFAVDPAMLARTAQGIRGVVETLGDVGHGYLAESGRGLSFLALDPESAGHPDVRAALDGFVERWGWGVRSLVQSGQEVAQALDDAGLEYDGVDTGVSGWLKRWSVLAVGDPTADLEAASTASWGDIGESLRPDVAPDAVSGAAQDAGDQWSEVGTDVAHQSVPGRIGRALDGGDPFDEDLEDLGGLREIVE